MTAFSGTDPRTAAVKTGQTVTGVGLLLTEDTGLRVTAASASEVAVGVSAGESSRDADLTKPPVRRFPSSQWAVSCGLLRKP
jgi:hypothetical protein